MQPAVVPAGSEFPHCALSVCKNLFGAQWLLAVASDYYCKSGNLNEHLSRAHSNEIYPANWFNNERLLASGDDIV